MVPNRADEAKRLIFASDLTGNRAWQTGGLGRTGTLRCSHTHTLVQGVGGGHICTERAPCGQI